MVDRADRSRLGSPYSFIETVGQLRSRVGHGDLILPGLGRCRVQRVGRGRSAGGRAWPRHRWLSGPLARRAFTGRRCDGWRKRAVALAAPYCGRGCSVFRSVDRANGKACLRAPQSRQNRALRCAAARDGITRFRSSQAVRTGTPRALSGLRPLDSETARSGPPTDRGATRHEPVRSQPRRPRRPARRADHAYAALAAQGLKLDLTRGKPRRPSSTSPTRC